MNYTNCSTNNNKWTNKKMEEDLKTRLERKAKELKLKLKR